ncbi:MAG TPA: hypothetical protein V6C69_10860 [Trichormus sp.]
MHAANSRQNSKAKYRLRQRHRQRSARGQQITEFAAALVLLVLLLFLPLLDLAILPVRYFMAQELIAQYARQLSHCETLTAAYAVMQADPSLQSRLIHLGGVNPLNLELHLLISTVRTPVQKIDVVKPKTIQKEWLPEGRMGPCEYILEVRCETEISPAVIVNVEPKILGLSKPVTFILSADSPWENLGRNPITKQFYVNE